MEEQNAVSPPERCECGGSFTWESVSDRLGERWLGVCSCGVLVGYVPEERPFVPADPLATVLGGPGRDRRPPSPPWIRVYRVSSAPPWNVEWLHYPSPCVKCSAPVVFEATGFPRPGILAHCLLCLQCGWTSVEHIRPGSGCSEAPLTGHVWNPLPCPAVMRLRRALFARWHRVFRRRIDSDEETDA